MQNSSKDIFEGLNNEQRNAVSCTEGPVLIVAGAGSGKTRVLTSRVANIIAKGTPPERILALTFTKKAAGEMKERISTMVGEYNARRIRMGTFHSVFIRFLREFADLLGYPKEFTIYDQGDSQSAIKACLKELNLDDKIYKPRDVLSRISMAKNNLVTPGAYRCNTEAIQNDTRARKPRVVDVYELYWKKCRQSGVMDFDDILLNMNILFRDRPAAMETIAGRFSYIMVDEYQDTNYSQYLILKKLCLHHHNLCVVGDDSQSIYAFRGARIENILNFRRDYPENRTFRLEQNYRSTQTIVNAANSLIVKNSARIPKNCFSQGEQGEKIRLINAYTDKEEALQIVSSIISRIHSDSAEYHDFAILYRTNAQSRALEEQLRRRNIPYAILSGSSFFERAEVKDMMAYFKLSVNPNDDESFKRVVNKPSRGIGETSLGAVIDLALKNGTSLFAAATSGELGTVLKAGAADRIAKFCAMMQKFSAKTTFTDAYNLASEIAVESELLSFYRSDSSIEGQSRTANVEELLNSVKAFVEEQHNADFEQMQAEEQIPEGVEFTDSDLPVVTLGGFLENISLLSNVDMDSSEESDNKVMLMTVHCSKGLEFPYVYVVGMEENLFPSGGSMASPDEIEEERRLFYVALTRAMKAVSLSFAQTRIRNGQSESNSPSRFVREIDRRYIENPLPQGTAAIPGDDFIPRRRESSSKFYGKGTSKVDGDRLSKVDENRLSKVYGKGTSKVDGDSSFKVDDKKSSRFDDRKPSSAPLPQKDFIPSPVLSLKAGQRVEHNRFGEGVIKEISGAASDLKARVLFDNFGEKTLVLKYAKMRIIG